MVVPWFTIVAATLLSFVESTQLRHDTGSETRRVLEIVDHLNQQFVEQKKELEVVKIDNNKLSQMVDVLMQQNRRQGSMIEELKTVVQDLNPPQHIYTRNSSEHLQELATGVVAFHVSIAAFTGSPTEDSQIPFDVVVLNLGNAYSVTSNEFIAPVDGVYSFSYEAMAGVSCGGNHSCAMVSVNGVKVTQSCSVYPNSAGTAVTVRLNAADTVWIATSAGGTCQVLQGYSFYNNFAGHLVYLII